MILFATHSLGLQNYFLIPSCTTKLWPEHDSGTHTHTHTHTHTRARADRVNSICASAISWRRHKTGAPRIITEIVQVCVQNMQTEWLAVNTL